MHWRAGTVERMIRSWSGAAEYAVTLDSGETSVRALAYTDVSGALSEGARVLLNVSALQRGLGTGGVALVVARTDELPADPPPAPGHIVKARYTPTQQMLLAIDEQESPDHSVFATEAAAAGDLGGMPVIAADLHSALPAILAGVRAVRPDARVVYVMTDGGALAAAFSRTLAGLRDAGWLAASITAGQAYGGDHEAVTVHSALLAARHVLNAELVIVSQGPGNAGTGTPYGFSGVDAGAALNAVHSLRGRGIGALRISAADARERHFGVSHHSLTAYGRLVLGAATIVVPRLPGEFGALVQRQVEELVDGAAGRLTLASEAIDGLRDVLRESPVALSTMGRGLGADSEYFLAQAAAGRYAARLLIGN